MTRRLMLDKKPICSDWHVQFIPNIIIVRQKIKDAWIGSINVSDLIEDRKT